MSPFKEGSPPEQPHQEISPELQPEIALQREKTQLERFREKGKKTAAAVATFLLLSTAAYGQRAERFQEEPKEGSEAEEVERGEKQIETANLTASSTWAIGIIDSARGDMGKISTSEDAEWLVRSHHNKLISEFYLPTKGNVKEGPYGVPTREYSEDDVKLLIEKAHDMKKILEALNNQFGIEAYEKRQAKLDDMIDALKRRLSYSWQKQQKALEEIERMIRQ